MEILLTSITAFVSTNIDDLFILTLFFGNKKIKTRDIIAGQFLGISALVMVSLAASLIGLVVDPAYVGLLGLVPIYLGLKGVWELIRPVEEDKTNGRVETHGNKVLAVAGVTFANGGDNIGIYTPLFVTLVWTDKMIMVTLFLVCTALWCMMAMYFTKHPKVAAAVDKYGHIVTPLV